MAVDRRAFLHRLRNVPRGLRARTKIITILESSGNTTAGSVAEQVALDYSTILYHLHNMSREGVVKRHDEDTRTWILGPNEQTAITDFLGRSKEAKKAKPKKR